MLKILLLLVVVASLIRALVLLKPLVFPPAAAPPPQLPDTEGWDPDRPISVRSAAVIEPRAAREPCLKCASRVTAENHQVLDHKGERLRKAPIACRKCDWTGALYFRLEALN